MGPCAPQNLTTCMAAADNDNNNNKSEKYISVLAMCIDNVQKKTQQKRGKMLNLQDIYSTSYQQRDEIKALTASKR